MRYVKPHYYDRFQCIAGECPDTCCAGWQIMIDEGTLQAYEKIAEHTEADGFGSRLLCSVDWSEGCFRQKKGRCAFLNDRNLCDLYRALGEEMLCETCTRYPRHIEEFEGLRELSLSLSCPVAAQMILDCEETVTFEAWEDEEEEEFEEFDFFLFTKLEDAREVMLEILQNRSEDVRKRMAKVWKIAREFQECVDNGNLFEVDDLLSKKMEEVKTDQKEDRMEQMKKYFAVLEQLELLNPDWAVRLQEAKQALFESKEQYECICETFHRTSGYGSKHDRRWQEMTEQLMVFWVFTYFCGAVYDDEVYSKMMLAIFSTVMIQELTMAKWAIQYLASQELKQDSEDFKESIPDADVLLWQTAYLYAREVEHSDENLIRLDKLLKEL